MATGRLGLLDTSLRVQDPRQLARHRRKEVSLAELRESLVVAAERSLGGRKVAGEKFDPGSLERGGCPGDRRTELGEQISGFGGEAASTVEVPAHSEERRQDAGHEALSASIALRFGRDLLAALDRFRDGRRAVQGGHCIVDRRQTDLSSIARKPRMFHRLLGGSGREPVAPRGAVRPGE